jgi:hypothetical protein
MNLNDPRHAWTRLTVAARTAGDDRPTAAPYGFATRVTALAMAQERKSFSLVERFALRALSVSCLLAVLSVAVNYSHLSISTGPVGQTVVAEDEMVVEDPVAALLGD